MSTKIYLSEVMMPSQTNPSGNVHGGEFATGARNGRAKSSF